MKPELVIGDQVLAFARTLAPETRQRLRHALQELAAGRGDIKPLERELAGLYRLRVGQHRVIFRYAGRQVRCFYAAPRDIVYDVLASRLTEFLDK
jgi:mRNA interferase RelE/StbE